MNGATTEDSATSNNPKIKIIRPMIGVIHSFLRIRRKAQSSLMNITIILTSFYWVVYWLFFGANVFELLLHRPSLHSKLIFERMSCYGWRSTVNPIGTG